MRKMQRRGKLGRSVLAVVLACGLMIPTTAPAAFADGEESATPPLSAEQPATGEGAFDGEVSDAPSEAPAAPEAAPETSASNEDAAAPETEGAEAVPEEDGKAEEPGDAPSESATPAFNAVARSVQKVAQALAATPAAASEPAAQPQAAARSTSFAIGGFTITGDGIAESDFSLASNLLTINTSKPFTISGSSTTVRLVVPSGVEANMTLNNITISRDLAFDIQAGGTANLILADGSTNSFTSTSTSWPGIHCGTGAKLTVDDSVANVDTTGKLITPEKGQIPVGTAYVANDGTTRTSKGDYLTLLDSKNPGKLVVKGGGDGAALGGAFSEDGGTMTFNGGLIEVTNGVGPNTGSGGGAGIGGGKNAAGTSPTEWITVNGGRIVSNASFHGAGFGGGWNSGTAAAPSGLTTSKHPAGTGNIRINGGYVESNGGQDGNGFGRGCYGDRKYCDNRDYTIIITGGTMIPKGGTNLAEPWGNDIGGAGTTTSISGMTDPSMAATVIISGGSVYVSKKGNRYRFDGVAYGSYTEDADGTITANKTNQVELITINLTADLKELTPEGETPDLNRIITSWKLLVGGEEAGYGAPAQFNNGNLYLWLTPEQANQQVTVQLTYAGNDGKPVPVEPLYRPAGGTGGDTNLKRYVFFDLQQDFFEDKGGGTGEATVAFDALSSYEQKKYGSAVDENGLVKVPVVKKPYDGLPYQVKELTADNSISSGGDDNKPIWEKISYLAQLYDAKTGKLGAEQASETLPTDTGLTRFTMTSTQYSNEDEYRDSYYGHRAYGWCEITPVPAVVKIAEKDGTAWVRLAADGSSYELVKETDKVPGNRLRVAFDVRSAKGTATTCKAPTGSFQVMIDGKPVGGPVALTEEAIGASIGSSIETVAGEEGRETTRVVYYLDPTRLDGALDALEADGQTNSHEVTVRYIPDKNYVEGTEENPDNEATESTVIIPVPPEGDVEPDDPDKVDIEDTPGPAPGPGGTDPDNPTGKATVVRKTITVNYGAFHKEGTELDDTFAMALTSSSSAPASWAVTNTAVADIVRGEDGKPALGEDGKIGIRVNSCGTSVITMEQKPNALFTGIKYILTVNVAPDPSIKPKVQIRTTWRNLTALSEAAAATVATAALRLFTGGDEAAIAPRAAALRAAAASDRSHTPPRPGDVLEYTVTGLNLTPGSAWQGAELKDAIDAKLAFDASSVQIAPNYATHSDKYDLGTSAFYRGFDWDGLNWADVDAKDFTYSKPTLTKGIGTVYGGQSTSVRFQAKVADDQNLGERPDKDGVLPEIENKPGGGGGYGKPEEDLNPGEQAVPPTKLDPARDIEIVGEGDRDPVTGKFPETEPVPVLPRDPAAADIRTTVKVETKATEVTHENDRVLIGDTLTVTATSENVAPDSKLAGAVIKVTLPKGADLKPGTIKLTDAQGNTYDVPDGAFDPKTGIVAVNAGDLYGGEKATLTFDVEITSTADTRDPADKGEEGSPERPEDFPIKGSTLGETPTDEWNEEHPDGPDGEPVPVVKPDPGTPFNPGKPWNEVEEEYVATPPAEDPAAPPVLPRDPKVEGADADIKVEKTAQNLSRDDGTTAVGDTVRYTVTLSNTKEHTMWYDAVFRDVLPKGLALVAGSIKVCGPDGTERAVPDSAYDEATRTLGVRAGDVAGGRKSVLVFDVTVEEAAIGADIGNVAQAYGTRPSDANPTEVTGESRPAPGEPFTPPEGWEDFARDRPEIANDEPAYPAGTDAKGGVKAAAKADPKDEKKTDKDKGKEKDDKKKSGKGTPLAKTGDGLASLSVALMALAVLSGSLLLLALTRRERRDEQRR